MKIVVSHTTESSVMDRYRLILSSDTIKHLVAGAVAGALSRTVVSPMERMKILFQVNRKTFEITWNFNLNQVQGPQSTAAYTGVWSTLGKIWKEEGFQGFMRGNGTNVIRMIPYSASQFAAYEQFKSLLMEQDKTELDTPRRLLAGALAGTVSVACTYPLDLVRTRLSIQSALFKQASNKKSPGIWPTMSHIYKTEGGIYGLYRGLWPTTLVSYWKKTWGFQNESLNWIVGCCTVCGIEFPVLWSPKGILDTNSRWKPRKYKKITLWRISGFHCSNYYLSFR